MQFGCSVQQWQDPAGIPDGDRTKALAIVQSGQAPRIFPSTDKFSNARPTGLRCTNSVFAWLNTTLRVLRGRGSAFAKSQHASRKVPSILDSNAIQPCALSYPCIGSSCVAASHYAAQNPSSSVTPSRQEERRFGGFWPSLRNIPRRMVSDLKHLDQQALN